MVAFYDNLARALRLLKFRSWWKNLLAVGQKYRYISKPSETILIVKLEYESKTAETFDNINIKITTSGQKYLGDVIGRELY